MRRIFGQFLSQLLLSKNISYLSCKKLYFSSSCTIDSIFIDNDRRFQFNSVEQKYKCINTGIFLSKVVFREISMINSLSLVESYSFSNVIIESMVIKFMAIMDSILVFKKN